MSSSVKTVINQTDIPVSTTTDSQQQGNLQQQQTNTIEQNADNLNV